VHDPKIPPITQFEVCKPLEPTSSPYLPHISRLRHQIPHLCDYHLRLPYLSKASCRNLPERWASLASARFFYIGSCPGLPQAGTSSLLLCRQLYIGLAWLEATLDTRACPAHNGAAHMRWTSGAARLGIQPQEIRICKLSEAIMAGGATERTSVLLSYVRL
jgi:hypothetical protein